MQDDSFMLMLIISGRRRFFLSCPQASGIPPAPGSYDNNGKLPSSNF
ncbi:Hypothetical protein ACI5QL_03744 [Bacillus velezensis]